MGDVGAGDVAKAGEVGVVFDLAAGEHAIELGGQRHEEGDAGDGTRSDVGEGRLWGSLPDALVATGYGL